MNFFDWMNMNMIFDIAFLVFTVAFILKNRKQNKLIDNLFSENKALSREIATLNKKLAIDIETVKDDATKQLHDTKTKLNLHKESILEMFSNIEIVEKQVGKLDDKIISVIKNPQAARRKLNQNKE